MGGAERLIDIVDELPGTTIPLACRAAHCGACRVRVEAGDESLEPAAADERRTLTALGLKADERLACQLRLRAEAVEAVVLRVLSRG